MYRSEIRSSVFSLERQIKMLGIDTGGLNIREDAFNNIGKIKRYSGKTLIIHAEYDHIIPFSDGEQLFDASPAQDRRLVKIPGANHNTIFQSGLKRYFNAIKDFSDSLR